MSTSRVRPRVLPHRLAVIAAALAFLALVAPSSAAITKQQVDAAKAKAKRLAAEAQAAQRQLDALEAKLAVQAERVLAAEDRLSETQAELANIREDQRAAQARYDELRAQLDERARLTYMAGPGSSIEFLLGATSLSDLSSRLEFINALSQHDGDLAVEVQNLQNQLDAQEARYEELKARQQQQLAEVRDVQRQLHDSTVQQAALTREAERKAAAAERFAKKVNKEFVQQIRQGLTGPAAKGVFKYCPVGDPHILTNSFGAPRYAGGFHLHAGNDIMAAFDTPIYAPFDGYAEASSNSLGGYSVYVRGSAGYVYNAHLIRPGISGPVAAGQVVGYVGNSGDAQGGSPHDHFEWHPNAIPSPGQWPASPYGYSVIGDAVNPYPLLAQVC